MENEIKVGDWVRTKAGKIHRVDKIIPVYENDKLLYEQQFICWDGKISGYRIWQLEDIIVKHSSNLIDLIQKDDFVNGDRVIAIDYTEDENGNYVDVLGIMEIDDDYAYPIELRVINIREIVTKEQFESISYKVKE